MIKSVLITGITGFIGRELAKQLLADSVKVHGLVRPTSQLSSLEGGLHSKCKIHTHSGSTEELIDIFQAEKPDLVFHLATHYVSEHKPSDIEPLLASNIGFTTQLLEAMATTGCRRLINAGTSWQHFGTTSYRPVNLYAATKQCAEDIITYYHDAHAISCTHLKLFDTYGPGDTRRKLLSILVDAARTGDVLDMSPGDQIIDLCHVSDVAAAFVLAAKRQGDATGPIHDTYFLSGERLTLKQLVDVVSQALGEPLKINFGGRPYRSREVMIPVDSAASILPGWLPRIRLRDYLMSLQRPVNRESQ